jgi:hypothetical protein
VAKPKPKPKLKVFRTPIGFHDAYVAAPSQKAALEAWGVDTNLFARGAAEQVSEPALTKVPLEHPGQVVKVERGTKQEQLAALATQKLPRRKTAPRAEIVPKKARKRGPKPSRTALTKAEGALNKLKKRQAEQIETLERRRRELQRRHERERDKAEERLEDERADYEAAARRYESG